MEPSIAWINTSINRPSKTSSNATTAIKSPGRNRPARQRFPARCRNQIAQSGAHQTKKHGVKLKELIELLLNQSPKPLGYEIRNDGETVMAGQK
jgi:hypothetical protein